MKKRQIRTKLACVIGIVFVTQGMMPPVHSFAEVSGQTLEVSSVPSDKLAVSSDASATPSDALENPSDTGEIPPEVLATPSVPVPVIRPFSSSTGDLWEEWNGDMGFSGDGTEENPYQIGNLAELMGLSELTAAGESFSGEYFELTQDIDLGVLEINGGNWNPIGWYQNAGDLSGDVVHSFQGHFDGGGNTISGLKIIELTKDLKNVGLFGVIDGGSVRNLTVEGEDIYGEENVAVLAGAVKGGSVIENVNVSGYVRSGEDAGGIAGEVTGGSEWVTIENCTADGIAIYSGGTGGFVGGIAGNVQKAYLVDNVTLTQDGDANRIYGKGYIGGIAGRMNLTQIYNAYVNGTIGGNGSKAVGGIVGNYESGSLVLARMAGDISNTNNGTASREGTFVGTREGRNGFTYGTERNSNFSYLYTNSAAKAKNVFGSTLDGDNAFTKAAHIGYWVDNEKKYVTVAGRTETACGERYFYEELEDAVRYIVTQKLGKEFTSIGYFDGLTFRIDHFAPGYMGEPVRGYLVSVPRIDARNANGTYDADVATLTALPTANSSYYRAIDKDHTAAVAPGTAVTVLTAPKNSDGSRYQMVVDNNETGGVKAPTYVDERGEPVAMQYVSGGSYSFTMPECDTELNAEYIKVTTKLAISPEETTISITQTRSGDRKNPGITTEVRNAEGILIARYIDGKPDQAVQVQPVTIHVESNASGQTADRTVKWSVDDINLITNRSQASYTLKDAVIMPNLESAFIQGIISREVEAQADNGYKEKINNTVYTKYAVVTAETNPDTSVNNQTVYANCRVGVTFQIIDNTTVRVEGMNLNKHEVICTVTRKLTGDRKKPVEIISSTEPVLLTARLYPDQSFFKNVSWADQESGKIIALTPSGRNTQDCKVMVQYDPTGKENAAWIQNIINEDNEKRKVDPYCKLEGTGSCTEIVTAISEDQTHGQVSDACQITVHFVTVDETVIHPEMVKMSQDCAAFDLDITKTGDAASADLSLNGFEPIDLDCTVLPELKNDAEYKPYDRSVIWSTSDEDALTVDQNGVITPNRNAKWIQDALSKAPYQGEKTVTVYAATKDNHLTGSTVVTLRLTTRCVELQENATAFHMTLKKTGRRTKPTFAWGGTEAKSLKACTYPADRKVTWSSSDPAVLTVSADGTITPVLAMESEWMKKAMVKPYTAETSVIIRATDETSTDECMVTLTLDVTDSTTSSSGSSSGGSGGGGFSSGGSSRGVAAVGATSMDAKLPSYVVTGTWSQNEAGRWMFTDSTRTYANEWAAIYNPYADTEVGQNAFDWFRFDKDGFMVSGWYTDKDGNVYYLNSVSDGTLGRMYTGWNWIDGKCYYFNEESDGTCGALKRNFMTTDGYQTNQDGAWVVNGVVQTK